MLKIKVVHDFDKVLYVLFEAVTNLYIVLTAQRFSVATNAGGYKRRWLQTQVATNAGGYKRIVCAAYHHENRTRR